VSPSVSASPSPSPVEELDAKTVKLNDLDPRDSVVKIG
jgi:hypothetical protein